MNNERDTATYLLGRKDGVDSCAAGPWKPVSEIPEDGKWYIISNDLCWDVIRWDSSIGFWKFKCGSTINTLKNSYSHYAEIRLPEVQNES